MISKVTFSYIPKRRLKQSLPLLLGGSMVKRDFQSFLHKVFKTSVYPCFIHLKAKRTLIGCKTFSIVQNPCSVLTVDNRKLHQFSLRTIAHAGMGCVEKARTIFSETVFAVKGCSFLHSLLAK